MAPDSGSRLRVTPRNAAVALLTAGVVLAMLLSSGQMADLRVALPLLSRVMNWLEFLPLPFDMDHVAFFALVAAALRLLLPRPRWWRLLLVLGVLAAGTEVLQFASDGRTPRWQDARDDMVGGGIGLLVGALLLWPFSAYRLRRTGKAASIERMTRDSTEAAALHAVLAGWLVGRDGCTPGEAVARYGVDALLSACEREGVVSLVHARLSAAGALHPVPVELMQPLAARARLCAARSLLCVSEVRKIQRALDGAGIPVLWLKGIALGQWLYPRPHLRDIADIDLLLPDHTTTMRAAEVLSSLGYVLPNSHIAGDLVVHELLAWAEQWRLELDLHWDVSNAALFANRLKWAELQAQANPLANFGEAARGLGPVHSLLHACIHRAVNHLTGREDNLRWLYDIHLLARSLRPADWEAVCALPESRGLATICHDGLVSSSRWLGTPVPAHVIEKLRTQAAAEPLASAQLLGWSGFQLATWRALQGKRQRLRWLRQLLLPDMAHLRVRYGADNAGTVRILARRVHDGIMRWRGYAAPK